MLKTGLQLATWRDIKTRRSEMQFSGEQPAMISQTVEYALRAIVTLAQHRDAPCTAQKISAITHVPGPYLSKLMQGLVRAQLVTSRRGLHGGFVLIKEPHELTIWDVVDAVEPIKRIRECPLGIASHGARLCPLHRRLDQALEMVERSFRETTVAEVMAQPGSSTPLCEESPTVAIADARESIRRRSDSGEPAVGKQSGGKQSSE